MRGLAKQASLNKNISTVRTLPWDAYVWYVGRQGGREGEREAGK